MTIEEKRLARKVLELAYEVLKEDVESPHFDSVKESLADCYIEFTNGYEQSLMDGIEKRWDNK
jgi:hypothetical protein